MMLVEEGNVTLIKIIDTESNHILLRKMINCWRISVQGVPQERLSKSQIIFR